ncbi:MAG TPA: hypothetical protein VM686_01010, partial [Polyangiaceae bacterium]|nr:hypothetical protein [Polyangiaceae bacterium]
MALSLAACGAPEPSSSEPAASVDEIAEALASDPNPDTIGSRITDVLGWHVDSPGSFTLGAGVDAATKVCTAKAAYAFASLITGRTHVNRGDPNAILVALNTTTNVPETTSYKGEGDADVFPCYWAMPFLARTLVHPTTSAALTTAARDALRQMLWRFVHYRSRLAEADAD